MRASCPESWSCSPDSRLPGLQLQSLESRLLSGAVWPARGSWRGPIGWRLATGSSSLAGGGEVRGVASTADTLAFRLASCWDILVISGMSSWAEQEQGGLGELQIAG
jgi:hypothetical protein